jgi:hypothetical protein
MLILNALYLDIDQLTIMKSKELRQLERKAKKLAKKLNKHNKKIKLRGFRGGKSNNKSL